MTETLGRRIVASPAGERVELHLSAWSTEHEPYQEVVGRVLARVLSGERVISLARVAEDGPARLQVTGLDDADRALLDERLPPPPPPDRRRAPAKGFARWAVELPRAVRVDPRFARTWTQESVNYVELADGATMLVVFVIDPLMEELAQVFRVRSGEGPKTLKGRREAIERSLEAHETLGLDTSAILPLLDPALDEGGVVGARRKLVEGWASHPADLSARAMALLCSRMAQRYYAKARKDGTTRRAQVVTSTVQPLLDVTLGSWEELLRYLGEAPAGADAQPLQLDRLAVPDAPPEPVAERIAVVRDWWRQVLDPAHAEQRPGMPSLWGLVPSPRVWEGDELREGGNAYDPSQWARRLPAGMRERIDELWGTTVLARYPDVLVDEPHPEAQFAAIVEPAAGVWEGILLTCWFLCFGPYSRTTLDGLRDYHVHALDELSDLGCPIGEEVFAELVETGRGIDWLFEQALSIGFSVTVSDEGEVSVEGQEPGGPKPGSDEVFPRLRDVITCHRRAWVERHLDRYLDARWRRDLRSAVDAYRELHVGRGKPPTVKQAYPKLSRAAIAWFGGDFSQLARCLNLEGPVTEPVRRSKIELPGDMTRVRRRVCELLGGAFDAKGDDYWPRRRRFELSLHVGAVLAKWQANGELPSRSAAMPGRDWLLREAFLKDVDAGYAEYLDAIRQALREVSHPAADAPLAEGRRGRPAGR